MARPRLLPYMDAVDVFRLVDAGGRHGTIAFRNDERIACMPRATAAHCLRAGTTRPGCGSSTPEYAHFDGSEEPSEGPSATGQPPTGRTLASRSCDPTSFRATATPLQGQN